MQGFFASSSPVKAKSFFKTWRQAGLLFVLLWIFASIHGELLLSAHAASSYYISPSGSDSNSGTLSRPFKTIQHCASVATAGSTCNIEAGTYHETVTPTRSGTSTSLITFQPYNGASVIVDGADAVSGWTVSSFNSSVYQASVTLNTSLFANQVFANGQMLNEARWPAAGTDQLRPTRLTAGPNTSKTTIYDSTITQSKDYWKGATVHYWGLDGYASKTATVTGSNVGELFYQEPYPGTCPGLCAQFGSPYYLSGVLNALTAPGEWFYDSSAHILYVWMPNSQQPPAGSVEAKQRTSAFDLSGRSYIKISGLSLQASTITTNSSSSNNTITNITANYVSHFTTVVKPDSSVIVADNTDFAFLASHELDTGIILNGSNNTLSNSTIAYSAGAGVSVQGSNNTVNNNVIHDVDYMAVYAAGINLVGSGHQITNNTVYRSGRSLINWDWHVANQTMQNITIANNDLFNGDMLTQDGGSLYICCQVNMSGSAIDYNLVHDDQSVPDYSSYYTAAGIYLDNGTYNGLIHHNVLWNNINTGLILNDQNGSSTGNLVYNNTLGYGQSQELGGSNDATRTGTQIINNIFASNQGSTYNSTATLSNNITPPTDPKFVNGTQHNYQLQSGSPAIATGLNELPYTNDGHTGSAPDLGAYPYNVTPWTAGASSATSILPMPAITSYQAGNNQVTLSWTTVKSATGYKVSYGPSSLNYTNTVDVGNVTSTTITGLTGGQDAYFAVSSYTSSSSSSTSTERAIHIPNGSRSATNLILASAYDAASSGITTNKLYIGNFLPGSDLEYDALNFGSGVSTVSISYAVSSPYDGQYIDVYADSTTGGTLLGTIQTTPTASFTTFKTVTIAVNNISGTHNLFLVARGPQSGNGVANVGWFSFDSHPVLNAFSQISGAGFTATQGDPQVDCSGTCVGHLDGGGWVQYKNVNFGSGVAQFTANIGVPDAQAGQNIEVHQDSPDGLLLGVLTVQSTGSFTTFTPQSFYTYVVSTGIHDVYLVIPGTGFGAGNINWLSFSSPATAGLLDRTNWTATASSSYSANPVTNAFDNDITTRWSTGQNEDTSTYYQIDLQTTQSFARIVLNSSNDSGDIPASYQVQVSSDGVNFGSAVATGNGSAITTITFTAQSARYIRISLTAGASHWWSVDEVYVYSN